MTSQRKKRIKGEAIPVTTYVASLGEAYTNDQPDGYLRVLNHEHKASFAPIYVDGPKTDNYPVMVFKTVTQTVIANYPTITSIPWTSYTNAPIQYISPTIIAGPAYRPTIRRVGWWRIYAQALFAQALVGVNPTGVFTIRHKNSSGDTIASHSGMALVNCVGTGANYGMINIDFSSPMQKGDYIELDAYAINGNTNTKVLNSRVTMEYLCKI